MKVPNWQHHSKKDQKRRLKPQAMRARKEALRQFKKRHMGRPKGRPFSVSYVHTDSDFQ